MPIQRAPRPNTFLFIENRTPGVRPVPSSLLRVPCFMVQGHDPSHLRVLDFDIISGYPDFTIISPLNTGNSSSGAPAIAVPKETNPEVKPSLVLPLQGSSVNFTMEFGSSHQSNGVKVSKIVFHLSLQGIRHIQIKLNRRCRQSSHPHKQKSTNEHPHDPSVRQSIRKTSLEWSRLASAFLKNTDSLRPKNESENNTLQCSSRNPSHSKKRSFAKSVPYFRIHFSDFIRDCKAARTKSRSIRKT
jgi:hypothetical protein